MKLMSRSMGTLISLCFYCFAGCASTEYNPFFLTNDGKPTPQLAELLCFFKIDTNGELRDIVTKTQSQWLRPSNVERFNMEDIFAAQKENVWPTLVKLGHVDEVSPKQKNYKYALIHGGSALTVRGRLSYLIELWNSGIKFDNIVFLTGQRDLDKKTESLAHMQFAYVDAIRKQAPWILPVKENWNFNTATMQFETETDMVKIIYNQTVLPAEVSELPVFFIDASKKNVDNGQVRRPNTVDTIESWLEIKPSGGNCLFISNQPFIWYQDAAVKATALGKDVSFAIETVGFKIYPGYSDSVSMILDSIARLLYEQLQIQSHS